MKNIVVITLFTIVFLTKLSATAQMPDKIIYNGKEYDLFSNPLEKYFMQNPDKRPQNGSFITSLWRGYVATFEVEGNELYVKDIEVLKNSAGDEGAWKSVMNEIFPGQTSVKVDWLTGVLVIPNGELKEYIHMGYASIYDNYLLLKIENGNFMEETNLNGEEYTEFREKQFEAFKKTEECKKLLKELSKNEYDDEATGFAAKFLRENNTDYITTAID